ncbi:MAG TPA: hypothetical protein VGG20_26850 [Thermoanaerobaculia bacterium]|jgi:hypothetical protein
MIYQDDDHGIQLRLSAQRALWGCVPASLRSVSLEMRGKTIVFRSVFAPAATDEDRELLSDAAGEVIADFSDSFDIEEEILEVAWPVKPPQLRYLVFLRAEAESGESS